MELQIPNFVKGIIPNIYIHILKRLALIQLKYFLNLVSAESFSIVYNGNSLRDFLIERFYDLTWDDKFTIAHQLSSAINYLHKNGIVHKDLVISIINVLLNVYCQYFI